MIPSGAVSIGFGRTERFTRCPWGTTLTPEVRGWLNAYWIARDVPALLPQRTAADPQVLEASAVIAAEHARIDAEERKRAEAGR